MTILLIEDNIKLIENLRYSLEKEGYSVDTATDGGKGLDKAISNDYDLIILDILLPVMNGFTVLESLGRVKINTPVLILSSKDEIEDKVKALDLGSYDYLTKPFALPELLARIRSIIRRQYDTQDTLIEIGDLKIDLKSKEVSRKGRPIILTAKEYQILEMLTYNRDAVVNRADLEAHVWGETLDLFTMSNFIDVHMKNLRKKIDSSGEIPLLHTKRGLGYILTDKNPEDPGK